MFGRNLIAKIKDAQLQGDQAHRIYSPPYRPKFSYEEILQKNPRLAAVNILLYLKEDEWHFPLILRTENERDKHSGQISLPGGSRDATDKSYEETAIRETAEEIGVERHYIRIIRGLSPIYIAPSNFYVYPYISYTKKNPKFILQESEALELIEFPLADLIKLTDAPEMVALPSSRGIEVPVIRSGGYTIWGATSMILSECSQLVKKL